MTPSVRTAAGGVSIDTRRRRLAVVRARPLARSPVVLSEHVAVAGEKRRIHVEARV